MVNLKNHQNQSVLESYLYASAGTSAKYVSTTTFKPDKEDSSSEYASEKTSNWSDSRSFTRVGSSS